MQSLTDRSEDSNRGSNPTVLAAVEAGEQQHVAWAYERPDGGADLASLVVIFTRTGSRMIFVNLTNALFGRQMRGARGRSIFSHPDRYRNGSQPGLPETTV